MLVLVAEDRQVADDLHPGGVPGARTIDCWRCVSADGSVLPITMNSWQRSSAAVPVIDHFRP